MQPIVEAVRNAVRVAVAADADANGDVSDGSGSGFHPSVRVVSGSYSDPLMDLQVLGWVRTLRVHCVVYVLWEDVRCRPKVLELPVRSCALRLCCVLSECTVCMRT